MIRLRIKSIELCITYPALCLFTGLTIIDYNYYYCFLSVIIHEASHLTAMILFKAHIAGLRVSLCDIKIIEKSRHILDYKQDMIITAAGPLINLLLFLFFFRINLQFACVNLVIGVFNLLPAASLDGGQLIYLFLSKHFTGKTSALALDVITVVVSIPLFVAGILVLFNSRYNFSFLFISLYLVLSLFVKEDKYV